MACLGVIFLLLPWGRSLLAAEITVAAATSLNPAVRHLAEAFRQETGHRIRLSLGSSGGFYSQIANGAPFDLFLSADLEYPRRLVEGGWAEEGTLQVYALGRLVLWVADDSSLDVQGKGIEVLREPSVRRIALANPRHAPYGEAAVSALRAFGLWEVLEPKVVLGESVSQALQFVQSGAADIGLVALSLIYSSSSVAGRYWEIPPDRYPEVAHGAVLLKQARIRGNLAAARALLAWLDGPRAREILLRHGFALPPGRDTP